MSLPIEKRLRLLSRVSNLMLCGSMQVYNGATSRIKLYSPRKRTSRKRAA